MKILGGNKIAIGMIVAAAGISAVQMCSIDKENTQIKSEIKAKDPERYDRLKKYSDASWQNLVNWKEEQQKMNDSLKMDSAVKKAYFEGAQMVRDSMRTPQESTPHPSLRGL